MAFSLDQFYRLNRRALIWLILFGLLWLLRDFFGLVFLTFVLAFFAAPMARFGQRYLRLPYRASLAAVYLLFLITLASFVRFVTPNVISEANRLLGNLSAIEYRLIDLNHKFAEQYPSLQKPFIGFLRSLLDEESAQQLDEDLQQEAARLELDTASQEGQPQTPPASPETNAKLNEYVQREENLLLDYLMKGEVERIRSHAPRFINLLYHAAATTLLALLFSFLILLDRDRLTHHVEALRRSRLRDFYLEAGQPVVRFGYVVGLGLQAQAIIAVVNSVLTILGLLVLSIPSVTMLSLIVFACSFIPIVGVFVSTIPIVLVALNAGGTTLAMSALGLVIVIHAIESYLLNPLIYGHQFKLNPVLSLMFLFLGYHTFGVWGMLLGIPVARYLISDVFGIPLEKERRGNAA